MDEIIQIIECAIEEKDWNLVEDVLNMLRKEKEDDERNLYNNFDVFEEE